MTDDRWEKNKPCALITVLQFCTVCYLEIMLTVDFTEFRKNASALLSRVEAGEVVEIRRHGKVVARLTPAVETQTVPAYRR
jgi:prevent-host-death family protein